MKSDHPTVGSKWCIQREHLGTKCDGQDVWILFSINQDYRSQLGFDSNLFQRPFLGHVGLDWELLWMMQNTLGAEADTP